MRKHKWEALIKGLKEKGYVMIDDILYPPNSFKAIEFNKMPRLRKSRSKTVKTGWIDDSRNIKNKTLKTDAFMKLIDIELGLEVWREFYFSTERLYRFDYAIPEYKVAIECNGGIWAKGNSGHSSGKGIMRDMDKNNLAQSLGWNLISVTPGQLMTSYTIGLINDLAKKL